MDHLRNWLEIRRKLAASFQSSSAYKTVSVRQSTPQSNLDSGLILHLAVGERFPVLRQQFFNFINGMGGDALQNIFKPYKRVDAV